MKWKIIKSIEAPAEGSFKGLAAYEDTLAVELNNSGKFNLYDFNTGQFIGALPAAFKGHGYEYNVKYLKENLCSQDGQYLFAVYHVQVKDYNLTHYVVWNLESQQIICGPKPVQAFIVLASTGPLVLIDGKLVFHDFYGNAIRELASKVPNLNKADPDLSDAITFAEIQYDTYLTLGKRNGLIEIWNLNYQNFDEPSLRIRAHSPEIEGNISKVVRINDKIVCLLRDKSIRVWDTEGKNIGKISNSATNLLFAHNFFVSNDDGTLSLRSYDDGRVIKVLDADPHLHDPERKNDNPEKSYMGIIMSHDEQFMAGMTLKNLVIWDLNSGHIMSNISSQEHERETDSEGRISFGLSFSKDFTRLANISGHKILDIMCLR